MIVKSTVSLLEADWCGFLLCALSKSHLPFNGVLLQEDTPAHSEDMLQVLKQHPHTCASLSMTKVEAKPPNATSGRPLPAPSPHSHQLDAPLATACHPSPPSPAPSSPVLTGHSWTARLRSTAA